MQAIPAPLHRWLYRLAHRVRVQVWKLWHPSISGVRIVAVNAQGHILLVRHSYGSGRWMTPGGGLRRGEDPRLAAARELFEEVGCVLDQARLFQVACEDLDGARNMVHLVGGIATGTLAIDRREIVDAAFFSVDALPQDTPAFFVRMIPQWIAKLDL